MEDEGQEERKGLQESDLINELQEEPNYLAVLYNEQRQKAAEEERRAMLASSSSANPQFAQVAVQMQVARAGGVYVPPHKLRRLQEEMMKAGALQSEQEQQRVRWEMLRKSINEIINKVNVANIQHIVVELLNENLVRGIGLLAKSLIRGQMASQNFTHVYAALIAVVNTKLPDVGDLVIRRVILQFRRAYQRNNKIVCAAPVKFLAHLINQKILNHLFGLELLIFFLENPTEDSVDLACDFAKECGQVLTELIPAGVHVVFDRLKGILHEGETSRRVQYTIENLFAIRKNKFKDYPGVIPELDLVEEADQITHNFELDSELDGEEALNIFKFDPNFEKSEQEWKAIKLSILGEDNLVALKTMALQTGVKAEDLSEDDNEGQVVDFSEEDLKKLRETIYLAIMNSLGHEEAAHKLIKMNIGREHAEELSKMVVECCMQERVYINFFAELARRFCEIDDVYKRLFFRSFVSHYALVHRFQANQISHLAKFFSHLLMTDALDWHVLRCVTLTEDATTGSSRIFLRTMFEELARNMGLKWLCDRMHDPDMKEYFVGIFPTDHPQNTRFAANFFMVIGLSAIAEPLRQLLVASDTNRQIEQLLQEKMKLEMMQAELESSSDSESSSSSGSSGSSGSSISVKKKKKSDKKPSTNQKSDKPAATKASTKLEEKESKPAATPAHRDKRRLSEDRKDSRDHQPKKEQVSKPEEAKKGKGPERKEDKRARSRSRDKSKERKTTHKRTEETSKPPEKVKLRRKRSESSSDSSSSSSSSGSSVSTKKENKPKKPVEEKNAKAPKVVKRRRSSSSAGSHKQPSKPAAPASKTAKEHIRQKDKRDSRSKSVERKKSEKPKESRPKDSKETGGHKEGRLGPAQMKVTLRRKRRDSSGSSQSSLA